MSEINRVGRKGKLYIPEDSKFPMYAGICMVVRLLLMGVDALWVHYNLDYFPNYFNVNTLAMVAFIVIAFLPKKNIKLFIIPIALAVLWRLWRLIGFYYGISISQFITFLCYGGILILFLLMVTGEIRDKKIVTVCCSAFAVVLVLQGLRNFLYNPASAIIGVLSTISFFAAYIILSLGFKNDPAEEIAWQSANGFAPDENKVDITKMVLLCLFTFGIYPLIWYYRTTKYLRQFSNEDPNNAVGEFLLILFIPFYAIYWHYKYSKILYNETIKSGSNVDDFTTLHLVLAIFIGIIAMILEQTRINELADIKAGRVTPAQQVNVVSMGSKNSADDFSEKMRTLSKLKDEGILTEEEYEQKKNQLLKKFD